MECRFTLKRVRDMTRTYSQFLFCFNVLDDIVNKYNRTVHKTIKIKPINVTPDTYAKYNEDSNKKRS